jgi:hypothetical protein
MITAGALPKPEPPTPLESKVLKKATSPKEPPTLARLAYNM